MTRRGLKRAGLLVRGGPQPLYGAQSDHPIAFIASHATCRCESALAAHQLDELLQLALVQIGNRPVMHPVLCPAVRAVAAPGEALHRLVAGALARPGGKAHPVLLAAVDERC